VDVNGDYPITTGQAYGPTAKAWTYESTPANAFFSTVMGSAQMLTDGNILVCQATAGNFFEVDSHKNVLWRYVNPVDVDTIVSQGTTPLNNGVFRCTQYDPSYSAFTGRALTPTGHIEKNAILRHCDSSTVNSIAAIENAIDIKVYPNPATDKIMIDLEGFNSAPSYQISDMLGHIVVSGVAQGNQFEIALPGLRSGLYIIKFTAGNQQAQRRLVVCQ
jgi:hypothetical protein